MVWGARSPVLPSCVWPLGFCGGAGVQHDYEGELNKKRDDRIDDIETRVRALEALKNFILGAVGTVMFAAGVFAAKISAFFLKP